MRRPQVAVTVLMLNACGADPGDIAVLERHQVESSIGAGGQFAAAGHTLEQHGYRCKLGTGKFVSEAKQELKAESFLICSKRTDRNIGCSINVQVILVPAADAVAQVHFSAGDVCL